jgi:hypothetical protein
MKSDFNQLHNIRRQPVRPAALLQHTTMTLKSPVQKLPPCCLARAVSKRRCCHLNTATMMPNPCFLSSLPCYLKARRRFVLAPAIHSTNTASLFCRSPSHQPVQLCPKNAARAH